MRDGRIGGNLTLSQVNNEQGTVFRIQEDLTASQHKLYKDAWEEVGQRSRSGKGEEWTVVGPKSKHWLLLKKRLEEGNRVSKEERKEAEQEKFDKIPKKVLQNGMVQRLVKRVHEIQDAVQDFLCYVL
jgi:DnaJ-domain-containing protein 1